MTGEASLKQPRVQKFSSFVSEISADADDEKEATRDFGRKAESQDTQQCQSWTLEGEDP